MCVYGQVCVCVCSCVYVQVCVLVYELSVCMYKCVCLHVNYVCVCTNVCVCVLMCSVQAGDCCLVSSTSSHLIFLTRLLTEPGGHCFS